MRTFYLIGLIILLNISVVFAQSGRVKQETKTNPPEITGLISNAPPPKRPQVILPSPLNLKQGSDIPDYIVYETVFRLAKVGWSASEERKFSPLEILVCRQYRMEKILDKNQEKVLNEIAEETMFELEKLNQQAIPIIKEFRAKMRSGTIIPGGERPMPPPELEEISQKKIKLIEGAIEKLKNRLGEKEFAGLNDFVNKSLRSGMKTGKIPTP